MADSNILDKIPHRAPFLWVDRVISQSPVHIETGKFIPRDLDLFQGHYPDYPILPGVILCEAIFQSGALLIADLLEREDVINHGIPVVTRIIKAKFKREVRPESQLTMVVKLKEKVGPAWFMTGKTLVAGKVVLSLEFACTLKQA